MLVQAAAELILESGDLTRRQVATRAKVLLGCPTCYFAWLGGLRAAALEQLAEELNDGLAVIAQRVAEDNRGPRVIATTLALPKCCLSDNTRACHPSHGIPAPPWTFARRIREQRRPAAPVPAAIRWWVQESAQGGCDLVGGPCRKGTVRTFSEPHEPQARLTPCPCCPLRSRRFSGRLSSLIPLM